MASITLTDKVSDEDLRKDHEHCLSDRMGSLQRELELYGFTYVSARWSRGKDHTILRVTGEKE